MLAINATTGSLLWEYETTGHVPSSPVVAEDIVVFSTLNGFVYALDRANGREIWHVDTDARIRSTGAIFDELIIFGAYRLGVGGGELFAFDLSTGGLMWSIAEEKYFFESSPTVSGDLLVIGNTDGKVYAVDPSEGTVLWTYLAGDPTLRQHPLSNRREVLSTPAVSEGVVYVSSNDGSVYAVNLVDQSLAWRTDIGNSEGHSTVKYSMSSPTIAGDRVFVGSNNGKIFALDTRDGTVVWATQTGSWVWSTPAYSDGIVYVGSDDRHLYALDAVSGQVLWKYDTGPGVLDREVLSGIWGDPLVADGTVYVTSQNGMIHAVLIKP